MTIKELHSLESSLIPIADLLVNEPCKGLAAVLVPLQKVKGQWHLLLTLRSSQLRHHAGEVAFPGGMWEEGDTYPVATALRESEEEIALPKESVVLLGGLEEIPTRQNTRVRPVVAGIEENVPLTANIDEIAAIFTVPIRFFLEDQRLRTDIFTRQHGARPVQHWVPAYQYGEYEIWGFTAAVIMRLMNRCFEADIRREHSAPEKIW